MKSEEAKLATEMQWISYYVRGMITIDEYKKAMKELNEISDDNK